MEEKLYTPLEAAEFLKVKKNTIYEMIKKGSLPAAKMGKQFRIRESDLNQLIHPTTTDIDTSAGSSFPNHAPVTSSENRNIIVCGQDIVLDLLCSKVNLVLGSSRIIRSYLGSYNGLHAMYKEEVTLASAHLWDVATDTYNVPFISSILPGEQIRLYHVLKRPVGLYVAKGNPLGLMRIEDFGREDVTIVNREKGSGIRVLTDSVLKEAHIPGSSVNGYDRIVNSHLAAAAIIAKGGADCAAGTQNVAMQFQNIDFIYLKEEQYDLAIREADLRLPEIQCLIETLQSTAFRDEIMTMGFYNVSEMGKRLL